MRYHGAHDFRWWLIETIWFCVPRGCEGRAFHAFLSRQGVFTPLSTPESGSPPRAALAAPLPSRPPPDTGSRPPSAAIPAPPPPPRHVRIRRLQRNPLQHPHPRLHHLLPAILCRVPVPAQLRALRHCDRRRIRTASGAKLERVLGEILRGGMTIVAIGAVLGVAIAICLVVGSASCWSGSWRISCRRAPPRQWTRCVSRAPSRGGPAESPLSSMTPRPRSPEMSAGRFSSSCVFRRCGTTCRKPTCRYEYFLVADDCTVFTGRLLPQCCCDFFGCAFPRLHGAVQVTLAIE